MYSSVHGVTGGLIMAVSPNPIVGGITAFISHFIWDYVGESSIGDTKKSSLIEGTLLALYLAGAFITGEFLLLTIGWVMANLPDLIDKPNSWFRGKDSWFSCHNGKGLFSYKGKKLGYPVKIRITKEQTLIANIGFTVIWFLSCIILR